MDPNRLFVDKTLFIKAFLDHSNPVLLITRPRRWGKTLTLSMLQHFLSPTVQNMPTKALFESLKIGAFLQGDNAYTRVQGCSPVISVTFKNLKGETIEGTLNQIQNIIATLYSQYGYLLTALEKEESIFGYDHPTIFKRAIDIFKQLSDGTANLALLKDSLRFLSELLYKYHHKKVFILIDEYDNAMNNAFDQPLLLKSLTDFFGGLLGACLKDNDYLAKGLITGILRLAKANIFSGLNNPTEVTVLDEEFSSYYGFTEEETNELFQKTGIPKSAEIKKWYNGYWIAKETIYNPWSIMQCIDHKGLIDSYWVDTSNPAMIRDLLINKTPYAYKQIVRNLLKEKETVLDTDLKKHVSLDDINTQPQILWSLLLHTGYLTLATPEDKRHVRLPNQEIRQLLQEYIDTWFIVSPLFSDAANALLMGDLEKFEFILRDILSNSAYSARIFSAGSNHAAALSNTQRTKEFLYQFLIMTELKCINLGSSHYEAFAELEGVSLRKTRPDCIILNHAQKLCIVIELKVAFKKNENLKDLSVHAVNQINQNHYGKTYQERGYHLLKVGIAFQGTDFEMVVEDSIS